MSTANLLVRLSDAIEEMAERIARFPMPLYDFNAAGDVVALGKRIQTLQEAAGLPRILEVLPNDNPGVLAFKVFDPEFPERPGVHGGIVTKSHASDVTAVLTEVNLPVLQEYLSRVKRYLSRRLRDEIQPTLGPADLRSGSPTWTSDAGTRGPANSELRRLLRSAISNANRAARDDREWWSTEIDTLCEKMFPLWSACGIEPPGIWTDGGNKSHPSPVPCVYLKTRHPDTQAERSAILRSGGGKDAFNAPARAVLDLMDVAELWMDWLASDECQKGVATTTDLKVELRSDIVEVEQPGSPDAYAADLQRALQSLAVRFKAVDARSEDDADYYVRRLSAAAGKIAKRMNDCMLFQYKGRRIGKSNHPWPDDDAPIEKWAAAWLSFTWGELRLWCPDRVTDDIGCLRWDVEEPSVPGERGIKTMAPQAGDWRERARDYADACELLAEWCGLAVAEERTAERASIADQPVEIVSDDWQPADAGEVSAEMERLRELAQRALHNPRSMKRVVSRLLRPTASESGTPQRWANWFARKRADDPLAADLHDLVRLLGGIAGGKESDGEGIAERLKYFADTLEPLLLVFVREKNGDQASPARPTEGEAVKWLTRWAECVDAEKFGNYADPPDPRAFKRVPEYWLPNANAIEGCPEQRQVLIELEIERPTIARQIDRSITRALACHTIYQDRAAEVGDADAQDEASRLWHAMNELASVLNFAADALGPRPGAVAVASGRHRNREHPASDPPGHEPAIEDAADYAVLPQEPGKAKRQGRLVKAESAILKARFMAELTEHPTLKDDPAALVNIVGVSESTIRRWLKDADRKFQNLRRRQESQESDDD